MTAVFVEDGVDKGAIWHFGEPNKEQKALLEGKAWADLSHLQIIAVSGVDRLKWLHDLTTQHLTSALGARSTFSYFALVASKGRLQIWLQNMNFMKRACA